MAEYAGQVLFGVFVQTFLFMTVMGCEPGEMKYVLKANKVLASNPSRMILVESRSLCALECEIEQFCVAFAFSEDGGDCYLYDRDVSDEVYDTPLNTNLYLKRCGSLPTRQNALPESVQASYPAETRVNYTCKAGAFLEGSPQTHCLPSGEWQTDQFTCKAIKSCQDADNLGLTVLPTVIIRPDPNQSAVTVSCEVTDNGIYTIIGHDVDNRTYVKGYERDRSYVGNINYNIDLQQAINIVDASAECELYIKFECYHIRIVESAGLLTRNGTLATYLIGGVKGQMDCACHLNNTCVNGLRCNCEKNDHALRVDEGYIRYKEDLPITAILIGDTGNSQEYAYYEIGNLRCKG